MTEAKSATVASLPPLPPLATTAQLAEALGVAPTTVRDWLRGACDERLAHALGEACITCGRTGHRYRFRVSVLRQLGVLP